MRRDRRVLTILVGPFLIALSVAAGMWIGWLLRAGDELTELLMSPIVLGTVLLLASVLNYFVSRDLRCESERSGE